MQGSDVVSDNEKDAKSSASPIPPQAVDAVGRKLKARYDEMLRAPIPDKLLQLLDDLDRSQEQQGQDGKKSANKGGE
jgi:hypothetical protein